MKKIIVPVDFSKYSENALKTAASFAKKFNAELIVLHMLELSNVLVINKSSDYIQKEAVFYAKLAEKKFDEFLQKDYLKGVTITPIVKQYKVFSEINELAKVKDVDLIIMGSHGATGLKEFFVGSNTEKVVRNSDIPVLVIKGKPVETNFSKVIFASDFSKESIAAFRNAKKFFEVLQTRLQLVYVNTPDRSFKNSLEMRKTVQSFLKAGEFTNYNYEEDVLYISDYSVEEGILNYAKANDVDIIAVATHGRKGIAHFLTGSVSEDVANHAERPVITFKI